MEFKDFKPTTTIVISLIGVVLAGMSSFHAYLTRKDSYKIGGTVLLIVGIAVILENLMLAGLALHALVVPVAVEILSHRPRITSLGVAILSLLVTIFVYRVLKGKHETVGLVVAVIGTLVSIGFIALVLLDISFGLFSWHL